MSFLLSIIVVTGRPPSVHQCFDTVGWAIACKNRRLLCVSVSGGTLNFTHLSSVITRLSTIGDRAFPIAAARSATFCTVHIRVFCRLLSWLWVDNLISLSLLALLCPLTWWCHGQFAPPSVSDWAVFPVCSSIHVECSASFCPFFHISVTIQKSTRESRLFARSYQQSYWICLRHCDSTFLFRDLEVFGYTSR